MSAQDGSNIRKRVPQEAADRGNSTVRAEVDQSWIGDLPNFCDARLIADIFGVSASTATRWMTVSQTLPSTKRPDGRLVTTREHLAKLAQRMYGEIGAGSE